jgi:hypothetical protein
MTLNANFAGARVLSSRLDGPERMLDGLIGLVIIIAVVLIGFMSVYALYVYGTELGENSARSESASIGFSIAAFGSAIPVAISVLVYLVRIARGTRSWTAPLTGGILMAVALVVGYGVMAIG